VFLFRRDIIMIQALSYVLVSTRDLPAWLQLAREGAGLQADEVRPGQLARLRMDGKFQRFIVQRTDGPAALGMGYTVADAAALDEVARRLAAAGFAITSATADELALRGVAGMAHLRDPDGWRVEIAHGLRDADSPFAPSRPISGFRTSAGGVDMGLGHIGLVAGDFAAMKRLYHDVLGFRTSDRASVPFVAEFFHVNPRHHTLGLADTGSGPGIYHLMLEYNDFDDVGRAYDIALDQPESIGVSLGRHTNDHMTSFYQRTPDGWFLELGWGGRLIGADWQVTDLPGLSLWGHDRSWLPPEKRALARQLLRDIADAGLRAPIASQEKENA
jgi:2,3-dihydroxybiphenyl 1,2-dioxygenase